MIESQNNKRIAASFVSIPPAQVSRKNESLLIAADVFVPV
jgi:hypothetical protein